jgi:hypothetical protein
MVHKNDQPIRGATKPILTIANVSVKDAAAYAVRVKNSTGSVLSGKAMLRVK